MEESNRALYAGLHFSAITYLQEIAWFNLEREISDEEALAIYKKAKDVFKEYNPGDDFEGSDRENELIEKLIPFF